MAKCGHSKQVLGFFLPEWMTYSEWIFVWKKDFLFWIFWCHSWECEMFWVNLDFWIYMDGCFPVTLAPLGSQSYKTFVLYVITAFKIQVLSMSATRCQGDFRIFHFTSAISQQKNCQRFSRNLYTASAMALEYLTILSTAIIWIFNSWDYFLHLNYVVYW